MDPRSALKGQYHASLAMLAEAASACPPDVWTEGVHPRTTWRIVLHAAFFTQAFLSGSDEAYVPWPDRPAGLFEEMWPDPKALEPYELPEDVPVMSQEDASRYIAFLDSQVDSWIDALDLEAAETGISWYRPMSPLSLQLMSLRHLQGHVGQVSERLLAKGIDIRWVGLGRLSEWDDWERANP